VKTSFDNVIKYDAEGRAYTELEDKFSDKRYGFVSNSITMGMEKIDESKGFFGLTDFDRAPYFRISHYDRVHDPNGDHQTIMNVDRDGALIAGWNMTWDRFYRIHPSIYYIDALGTPNRRSSVLYYNENTRKFDTVGDELTNQDREKTIQVKVDALDNTSEVFKTRLVYTAAQNEFAIISTGEIHNITFVESGIDAQRKEFINWALYPSGEALFANGGLVVGQKKGIPYVSFGKSIDTNISTLNDNIEMTFYIRDEVGLNSTIKKMMVLDSTQTKVLSLDAFNAITAQTEDATYISANNGEFAQASRLNGSDTPSTHQYGGSNITVGATTQMPANPYFVIMKSDPTNNKRAGLYMKADPNYPISMQVKLEDGETLQVPTLGQSFTIIYNFSYYTSQACAELETSKEGDFDFSAYAEYHKKVIMNFELDPNQIYFDTLKSHFLVSRTNSSQSFEKFHKTLIALRIHDYFIDGKHLTYEFDKDGVPLEIIEDTTRQVGIPTLVDGEDYTQNVGMIYVNKSEYTSDEVALIKDWFTSTHTLSGDHTEAEWNEWVNTNAIPTFKSEFGVSSEGLESKYAPIAIYLIDPTKTGKATLQYTYNGVNYRKKFYFDALAESAGFDSKYDVVYLPVKESGQIDTTKLISD